MTRLQNKVQLIAYPDGVGEDLKDLQRLLKDYLQGVVHGVHILPFYPSSADRGFAPLTHLEVEPMFGTWDDIAVIGERYDLVVDLVINHISTESMYFQDFIEKGDDSEWSDIFLDVDDLLARHEELSDEALRDTYRPRPSMPIHTFTLKDGSTRRLWCTFTNSQVDLDMTHQKTRELMSAFITNLIEHNSACIRLDAVGYTIKKPKTNSFLIPETFDMMRWVKMIVKPHNTELLAEVHHDYRKQIRLAEFSAVDWVYDFSLPLLVIHALLSGTSNNLKNWIQIRPHNQFTTLDTHDGIGVVDVAGLMTDEEIARSVASIHKNGGESAFRATGDGADNVDIYQVNATYYSALGENDDAYITARAIQFFVPGIPQVYYVGLFAGSNDVELLEETNHGRDINRHRYTFDEIDAAMERTVVKRLFQLIRFRNDYPAFDGDFSLEHSDVYQLRLKWQKDDLYCIAKIDLQLHTVTVEYVDETDKRSVIKTF